MPFFKLRNRVVNDKADKLTWNTFTMAFTEGTACGIIDYSAFLSCFDMHKAGHVSKQYFYFAPQSKCSLYLTRFQKYSEVLLLITIRGKKVPHISKRFKYPQMLWSIRP